MTIDSIVKLECVTSNISYCQFTINNH